MDEFDLFAEGFEEAMPASQQFMETLGFSIIPFSIALLFALIAPPLGATLAMRDESVSAIALPITGTAIVALLISMGIHPDQTVLLYPLTVVSLIGVMTLIHLYVQRSRSSQRLRSIILAALFVICNTIVLIVKEKSMHVASLFDNVLEGDLLVGTPIQLILTAIMVTLFLGLGVYFRGYLYTFSIDSDLLKMQKKQYKRTMLIHRFVVATVVTGGILIIGPLLTTALLLLPGFLLERYSKGLSSFLISTMIVSFIGCVIGFLAAIHFGMTPGPIAVAGIVVISLITRYIKKYLP